jgi:hypothetical protein
VRSNSTVFPILLILVGIYFLLEKQHLLPDLGPMVRTWWPLALIVGGVILLVKRSRRGG